MIGEYETIEIYDSKHLISNLFTQVSPATPQLIMLPYWVYGIILTLYRMKIRRSKSKSDFAKKFVNDEIENVHIGHHYESYVDSIRPKF